MTYIDYNEIPLAKPDRVKGLSEFIAEELRAFVKDGHDNDPFRIAPLTRVTIDRGPYRGQETRGEMLFALIRALALIQAEIIEKLSRMQIGDSDEAKENAA